VKKGKQDNSIVKFPPSKHGHNGPKTYYVTINAENPSLLMQSYNFSVSSLADSVYSITALPKHKYVEIESGVETILRLETDDQINYFYKITNPNAINSLELQITQRHFRSEEGLRKVIRFGFKLVSGLLLEGESKELPADEIAQPKSKLLRYDEISTFFRFRPMEGFFVIYIKNPLNMVDQKGDVINPLTLSLK